MIKIFLFTLVGISVAQVCPPPEVLYPCGCSDHSETTMIFCLDTGNVNLKEIFNNASGFVNEGVIFDQLAIYYTSFSTIEEGTVQHLKFRNVFINNNPNLTYISPRAFNASRNYTTVMSLLENSIEHEAPHQRDFFDFINSFKNLEFLQMVQNRVSSIPDDAFQNMTSLEHIQLYNNSITSIGCRAFSDSPRLKQLHLFGNLISSESICEEAFDDIGDLAYVILDCNKIDYMEQKRFQTLLDTAQSVSVGNAYSLCPDSEYARLHCDERANWICDNEEGYRGKLQGFLCKDGTGYEDIWEYCKARNNILQVR